MAIQSDWHIHTRNSCDGACLSVEEILASAESRGIKYLGITDHLHTQLNLSDIAASRQEFEKMSTSPFFHFGIEVSCVSKWELEEISANPEKYAGYAYGIRGGGPENAEPAIALTREDIEKFEIEYVVGGTHWPLYVDVTPQNMIRDYHRQNMFLACNNDIDIVAHPWWWMGQWMDDDGIYRTDPWLKDFKVIPKSMHDEFAIAVTENDKIVEINLAAMIMSPLYTKNFKKQYCEYLAELQARHVKLAVGSDTHTAANLFEMDPVEEMLTQAGVNCDDSWCLPPLA